MSTDQSGRRESSRDAQASVLAGALARKGALHRGALRQGDVHPGLDAASLMAVKGRSKATTKSYRGAVSVFLAWCGSRGMRLSRRPRWTESST
jgi:hypothetical protein